MLYRDLPNMLYDLNRNLDKNADSVISLSKKVARKMAAAYTRKKSAWELKETQYKNTGSLDMTKIMNYKTSDDIFTKKTMQKNGKSHGFVCSVDFSASMLTLVKDKKSKQKLIDSVIVQFLVLSLFGKYTNMSFNIFSYTSGMWTGDTNKYILLSSDKMKESEIINMFKNVIAGIYISDNNISSKTSSNKKLRIYADKIRNNVFFCGTPLAEASLKSFLLAKKMKDDGIQNVVTLTLNDGLTSSVLKNDLKDDEDDTYLNTHTLIDPFLNIPITHDSSKKNTSAINLINRMCHIHGIKTFNLYLVTRLINELDLCNVIGTYNYYHDLKEPLYDESSINALYKESKSVYELEDLLFYNKVIVAEAKNMFSYYDKDNNTDLATIKSMNVIGSIIVDELIKDFT